MGFHRDKPPWRRLVLIFLAGVAGAIGVFAFGRYVEGIDDTFGAIPASWGFKAQSREVETFFDKGTAMTAPSDGIAKRPAATHDPVDTETATFALG